MMLNQKSIVLWFTGLSGSGKTTLAEQIKKKMSEQGLFVYLLDGDSLRNGLNKDLGFSDVDREENIRRIAEVAKILVESRIIVIVSTISPTIKTREIACSVIGAGYYRLIYLNSSLDVCEKRDVKGLYQKVRRGEIKNFTGISQEYQIPVNPSLIIDTEKETIDDCVKYLYQYFLNEVL